MTWLRTLLRSNGPAAIWLLVAALAVRALVPQGFMVAPGSLFALMPCPQATTAAVPATHHMTAGHAATGHEPSAPHEDGRTGDGVCAFAPLGHGAAPGVDPLPPIATIDFALALMLGVAALSSPAPRRRAFLQPHPRGPPPHP